MLFSLNAPIVYKIGTFRPHDNTLAKKLINFVKISPDYGQNRFAFFTPYSTKK